MSRSIIPPACFHQRIASVGGHVDRGEWACGLVILSGLRDCAKRRGCRADDHCAAAAEQMLGDLRSFLDDVNGAALP